MSLDTKYSGTISSSFVFYGTIWVFEKYGYDGNDKYVIYADLACLSRQQACVGLAFKSEESNCALDIGLLTPIPNYQELLFAERRPRKGLAIKRRA